MTAQAPCLSLADVSPTLRTVTGARVRSAGEIRRGRYFAVLLLVRFLWFLSQTVHFQSKGHVALRCAPSRIARIAYWLPASCLYKDALSITQSDQSRLGMNANEAENVQRDLVPATISRKGPESSILQAGGELTCSTELEMSNDCFPNILPHSPFQMTSLWIS